MDMAMPAPAPPTDYEVVERSIKKSGVASVGALLTSLLVTPLEVAKTRLQAQGPIATVLSVKASPTNYCYCTHFQYSNGLMDHMVPKSKVAVFAHQAAVTVPHADCPVHGPPPAVQLRGTMHALSHIVRTEGVRALYAGLPPTLLIAVPSTVFYFTSYDLLLANAKAYYPDQATLLPFVCGSFARCVSATVVSPLELIRVRMQAAPNAGSFAEVLGRSVGDGVFSLWRGLMPTLARDVPFSALYWGFFEILKANLTTSLLHNSDNHGQTQLGIAFVAGATSGAVATVLTQPFDVVKTKRQMETFSMPTAPQHLVAEEKPRVMRIMADIVRTEGMGGLMTGLSARVAKVAPACAIMISTYEAGKQFLGVE
ncbi:Aste57867_13273 [Aphanomyces stellatus]|uniref:Aste57867_13273 protein n=1 Tax=Aphanomyces stellatus TaxID=120398 RepID=A0A485KXR0_9STRA|nr:hypothetical protein As57867_013224 [Aphanomyces stellatus]VFT90112.1 Aste57867_13273 [Aphanomyces stellatus]